LNGIRMIVPEKDAIQRLSSPLNLINRLRTVTPHKPNAMDLFQGHQGNINTSLALSNPTTAESSDFVNPFSKTTAVPESPSHSSPNLDTLLDNANSRIKLGIAHDTALDTLVSAVGILKTKLDDMKPDKLPSAIMATSKVVDSIQRQRLDQAKIKSGKEVHYHFYTPTQKKTEDYEIIEVG